MQRQVIEMISKVKEDPSLVQRLDGNSDIIHDAGLDSLQLVHFMLQIEDRFDFEIDFDSFELEYLKTVDTFCNYIKDQNGVATAEHGEEMETV